MFNGGVEERLRELEDTLWDLLKKPTIAIINASGVLEIDFTFISASGRVEIEVDIFAENNIASSLTVNAEVYEQLNNFYQITLNAEMNKEYNCNLTMNYGLEDIKICKIKLVGKDLKYEIIV